MPQNSSLDNAIHILRRRTSDSLRFFRSSSKDSVKSAKSTTTGPSYFPYQVYEQTMFPIILRDQEALKKLFEIIVDAPSGRRSLSRLARTCKALCEPALDVLWKDLDSLVPIVGLFPGSILKRTRRPGMGLNRLPVAEDWKAIIKYGERVQRITYDESANNLAPSILSVFEECSPTAHVLPNLRELSWKIDTAAVLDRCSVFLNPKLQVLNLEISCRCPTLNGFLTGMSARIKLKGFSFISPILMPESLAEHLSSQYALEKVVLVAPGALSPAVGRWIASLPSLRNLQLDLRGREPAAVEGFFERIQFKSETFTPNSTESRDSGVFSADELDFTEIRKSTLRLTGDLTSKGSFVNLKRLQLTGNVGNIAVFLGQLECPLIHLDLVIDDPPDAADWKDLSELICDRFSASLQSFRISATPSSRFSDLVRSTSRAEPSNNLSFEKLTGLSGLVKLDVDLPESIIFTPRDIEFIANACPNLEVLKLCPLSRFSPPHHPKITLQSLGPLMQHCKRLHTLAVVFNATQASEEVLKSPEMSSTSLLRLHVGHSWANNPLQIAILLSHFAPSLEILKWFQEKNRVGFIELHAKSWQTVSEMLPHLRFIRSTEKSFLQVPNYRKPETSEKGVDASVTTISRGVVARVITIDASTQYSLVTIDRQVDATLETADQCTDATTHTNDIGVEAIPPDNSTSIGIQADEAISSFNGPRSPTRLTYFNFHLLSSIYGMLSIVCQWAVLPISFSSRLLHFTLSRLQIYLKNRQNPVPSSRPLPGVEHLENVCDERTDSIALDTLHVRQ